MLTTAYSSDHAVCRRRLRAKPRDSHSMMVYIFPSVRRAMADVTWRMKGQYIKNCNCIATCPCDTIGFPHPGKGCEGMAGMYIPEGNFGNVKLDGLSWVVAYAWAGAVHEGKGAIQPFIDKKTTEEKRDDPF